MHLSIHALYNTIPSYTILVHSPPYEHGIKRALKLFFTQTAWSMASLNFVLLNIS